jgi:hypothetical protein
MFWQSDAPGVFDATIDEAANAEIDALNDPLCKSR